MTRGYISKRVGEFLRTTRSVASILLLILIVTGPDMATAQIQADGATVPVELVVPGACTNVAEINTAAGTHDGLDISVRVEDSNSNIISASELGSEGPGEPFLTTLEGNSQAVVPRQFVNVPLIVGASVADIDMMFIQYSVNGFTCFTGSLRDVVYSQDSALTEVEGILGLDVDNAAVPNSLSFTSLNEGNSTILHLWDQETATDTVLKRVEDDLGDIESTLGVDYSENANGFSYRGDFRSDEGDVRAVFSAIDEDIDTLEAVVNSLREDDTVAALIARVEALETELTKAKARIDVLEERTFKIRRRTKKNREVLSKEFPDSF